MLFLFLQKKRCVFPDKNILLNQQQKKESLHRNYSKCKIEKCSRESNISNLIIGGLLLTDL